VTAHPFSQKTALEQGMGECALFLAVVPPTEGWKGLTNLPSPRGSLLVEFKYLHGQPASGIYAPPRHAGMLGAIYANLNAGAVPRVLPPPGGMEPGGESTYHIHLIPSLKFARIRIDRFGSHIVADIRHKLRELCLQRWDIIHLILSLADPLTPLLCPRFEELGFFFAGMLPFGLPSGDTLILQYLNTCCADYEAIQTAGRFAPDLVAYVKACDADPTASQGG
jgi:serine/threonine-protein kinase RsbW